MSSFYDHRRIEKKWQQFWLKNKTFQAEEGNTKKEKYYILDMFPYPSSAGLHVGHPLGYTATDIIARFERMHGKNVLHPMGWDAFGLPAENYAIKTKVHPEKTTLASIETFRRQIQELGFSYDWSREVNTSSANYYRWTQWFFSFLYKNGLAYRRKAAVNWCESCHTVLANEQVINGRCERCKNEVVQKELEQWFFKIREFIEDQGETAGLLTGLQKIDWPESTKIAQENWIGRSEGLLFSAPVKDMDFSIQTFSAHFESFAADTFVAIAPDHPLLPKLLEGLPDKQKILDFCTGIVEKRSTRAFGETETEAEGIFTGRYIVDPVGNGDLPIWVASFALADYGTGIVKCSAHDERDFAFAKKYGLHLKAVLFPEDPLERKKVENLEYCFFDMKNGILSEPVEFSGKKGRDCRTEIIAYLEKKGIAKKHVSYKLRDWLVSRQRYWGAPIPVVYDDQGDHYLLPDDELPVNLPHDVDFMPTGESPLVKSKSFHDPKDLTRIEKKLKKSADLPNDRHLVRRESDTMDTFVCSSWYMFRFMDPQNKKEFARKEMLEKWGPVNLYVGGAEHTVLHLLYARFFTKVLHKYDYVSYDEPFLKLRHQGMILGEDGQKMSKSRGNVINPDEIIERYGADTLRCYEMFMGPFDQKKPWAMGGVQGIRRFLEKVWNYFAEWQKRGPAEKASQKLEKLLHKTIKNITADITEFKFNTAISELMIFMNEARNNMNEAGGDYAVLTLEEAQKFLLLLSPFAPHLAEELWHTVLPKSGEETIAYEIWPQYEEKYLEEDMVTYAVQVNGKLRGDFTIAKNAAKEEVLARAKNVVTVEKHLAGKEIIKEIFVPMKIAGFVVK